MREAADRLLAATDVRRVELGKRWKQVYQEAGLTHQTLNRWRNGHPVDALTERRLEQALMWAPGARQAIANGRDPLPLLPGGVPPEAAEPEAPDPDVRADAFLTLLDGEPAQVREAVIRRLKEDHDQDERDSTRRVM